LECGCRHERIVSEIVHSELPSELCSCTLVYISQAKSGVSTYSYFPPAPNPRPPSLLISPLPNWVVSVVRTLHKVFVSLLSLSDTGRLYFILHLVFCASPYTQLWLADSRSVTFHPGMQFTGHCLSSSILFSLPLTFD
jgi:hypothetical protein